MSQGLETWWASWSSLEAGFDLLLWPLRPDELTGKALESRWSRQKAYEVRGMAWKGCMPLGTPRWLLCSNGQLCGRGMKKRGENEVKDTKKGKWVFMFHVLEEEEPPWSDSVKQSKSHGKPFSKSVKVVYFFTPQSSLIMYITRSTLTNMIKTHTHTKKRKKRKKAKR